MSVYAIEQKKLIGSMLQTAYPTAHFFVREFGYTLQLADEAGCILVAVTHQIEESRYEALLAMLNFLVGSPSEIYPEPTTTTHKKAPTS